MAGRIVFLAGFLLLMAFGLSTSYFSVDPEGAGELSLGAISATTDYGTIDKTTSDGKPVDAYKAAQKAANREQLLRDSAADRDALDYAQYE